MKPRALLSVRPPVDPAAAEAFLAGQPFPAPQHPATEPAPAPEPSPLPVVATTSAPSSSSSTLAPSAAPAPALPGRRIHERKDGRRVRRTTILMRDELARRLDVFAASHGVDKTTIHEAALESWLASRGG